MASQRSTKDSILTLKPSVVSKRGPNTRSKNTTTLSNIQNQGIAITRSKRKAENSPLKNERVKRSALGNLTNSVFDLDENSKGSQVHKTQLKKITANDVKIQPFKDTFSKPSTNIVPRMTKIPTRASTRCSNILKESDRKIETDIKIEAEYNNKQKPQPQPQPIQSINKTVVKKEQLEVNNAGRQPARRISNEFEKTEESLYVSALEDISPTDSITSKRSSFGKVRKYPSIDEEPIEKDSKLNSSIPSSGPVPDDVNDFDKENLDDISHVSDYVMDIFNYLKDSESKYPVPDYMDSQPNISRWMRSLLIDWMVEVQESFELNHETLYLGVKLIDRFLAKEVVQKDFLQLLGAAALFISAKFDERTPPLIEDFLYICDGAYSRTQLIKMEIKIFKCVDYDLGIPISYRFLRRFARCAKVSMAILTLARYILEFSLLDYDMIFESDSKLASAALYIALRMNDLPGWSTTLEYYSGYCFKDFDHLVVTLNSALHKRPKDSLNTIRNKYSHVVFHQVAKKPLLDTPKLLQNIQGCP